MASLIKQHGRYYLQFYDAGRTPKQKRKALGVTTKRDAKPLKRKFESLHAAGRFDPWHEDPQEVLRRFLGAKRRTGRAEPRLACTATLWTLFVRETGEETKLRELPPFCRQAFLPRRRCRPEHSPDALQAPSHLPPLVRRRGPRP